MTQELDRATAVVTIRQFSPKIGPLENLCRCGDK